MKTFGRLVTSGLSVLLVGPVLTASAEAAPATPPPNCVVILDPLKTGQTESRVATRKCSSDPRELASVAQANTLLMRMYITADFNPTPYYTDWYGTAGTCDTAGYGVRDIGAKWGGGLDDDISSFKVYGACNEVGLYENAHYNLGQPGRQQFYRGNTSYVGAYMNDRATSIVVYHAN